MAYAQIKALVALRPGMQLVLIERGEHRSVEFRGFVPQYVGPLDPRGYMPGVWENPERLIVFDARLGQKLLVLSGQVVIDKFVGGSISDCLVAAGTSNEPQRIGDLPHPIELWPGDRYKEVGRHAEWFTVTRVFFVNHGKPIYEAYNDARTLKETRHYGFDVSRGFLESGNVYKLYHDEELSFESDEEALAFWIQNGVSARVFDSKYPHEWAKAFVKGDVDIGVPTGLVTEYAGYKLHPQFAAYREQVRALAERLYYQDLASFRRSAHLLEKGARTEL